MMALRVFPRTMLFACVALLCGCHAFSSLEIYAGEEARIFVQGTFDVHELRRLDEPMHGSKAPTSLAVWEGRPVRPDWLILRIGDEEQLFWYDGLRDAYACGDSSTRFPVVSVEQIHNGMVPVWRDYLDLSEALPNASADAPRE